MYYVVLSVSDHKCIANNSECRNTHAHYTYKIFHTAKIVNNLTNISLSKSVQFCNHFKISTCCNKLSYHDPEKKH